MLMRSVNTLQASQTNCSPFPQIRYIRSFRIYYHIESDGEAYLKELQHDYENMVSGMSAIFDSLEKGDTHE